jgi:ribosome biogenesis GTPase
MRYKSEVYKRYPAVGDWVVIKPKINEKKAIIQTILPRKSKFSRKVAGELTQEQIVSANVDTVFIVSGLDGGRNLNLRRIERYLTLAWNSRATPVLILNKLDLCPEAHSLIRSIEDIAQGVSIHALSAKEGSGLEALGKYFIEGHTVAFLGSSGVGKSTLINALLGFDRQTTGEVRNDDHAGRHITTRRELILLPGGGIVIDTPGMRELQMWADDTDLQGTFRDINTLARGCRFKDCTHKTEIGCAVTEAISNGELDAARLESYRKLQDELNYVVAREEHGARHLEKLKWKKISKRRKDIRK